MPCQRLSVDASEMAKRKQRSNATQITPAQNDGASRPQQASPVRAPRRQRRGPRTASGKKADPTLMADAAQNALEGLRERTEQGHLKAGRTPPSQVPSLTSAGA